MYINIVYYDLGTTDGTVIRNGEDDGYTIVVNSRSSYEQQQKTIAHEKEHIKNKDFEYVGDVSLLERSRHEA
jgi:hypothetical protein